MPLGRTSEDKLTRAHPALARLVVEAARNIDAGMLRPLVLDTTVACTFRSKEEQDAAFNARPQRSKKPWPTSGHNSVPARAVDFLPFPLAWEAWEKDASPLWLLQGFVRARAQGMGIRLKPVIIWDLPHYELEDVAP